MTSLPWLSFWQTLGPIQHHQLQRGQRAPCLSCRLHPAAPCWEHHSQPTLRVWWCAALHAAFGACVEALDA